MLTFDEIINQNWADRFGCSTQTLQQSGTTLLPEKEYAGKNLITLWHIGRHAFARFDPACADLVHAVCHRLPGHVSLSSRDLLAALDAADVAWHDTGLIHYLRPSDMPEVTCADSFHVRQLSQPDQARLAELYQACTPEEVEEGYVEIEHEIAYGCFHGEQLVAAASGYRIAGFMDIGVLTHSGFRKMGLARAVSAAICVWSASRNIIAQYRCNINNTASIGVAHSLGFRRYFHSESIALAR